MTDYEAICSAFDLGYYFDDQKQIQEAKRLLEAVIAERDTLRDQYEGHYCD